MNVQGQEAAVLLRENIDGIALLTLNRPSARNSLSEALIVALQAALDALRDDDGIRVVVIAANGPVFCAGHDLKELTGRRADADGGRAFFQHIMSACSTMMQAIVDSPKPVIAAVQGVATAAGCQLVASCDLAIASHTATFTTPGVDIGLFCSTPMVALSRNVPRKRAMEMLLTGEAVTAAAAADMGLVNRVVVAGAERDAAIELARTIGRKSAQTIKLGKAAFYRQADMNLANAYCYAAELMATSMMTSDAREGLSAVLEKREPKWETGHAAAAPRQVTNHDAYPDDYIRDILRSIKTIAMVGASPNTVRPSYFVFKYMIERGYNVIPINPGQTGKEMLGRQFASSLAEVSQPIDMVDVFRGSENLMPVLDEVLALPQRPKVIWTQLGVRNDEFSAKAEAAGIKVVMNRCPKIEFGRLSSEISWMGINSRTLSSKRAPMPANGFQRLSLDRQSQNGGDTAAADRAAREKRIAT